MKKFILSFVALLAVGTMTKATNGIVDGQLPSAMDATSNPEICKEYDYTVIAGYNGEDPYYSNFNGTGDVFPIYDDCKTNVHITLTTVGTADYHTFIYEINDASGYATMLGNYNGWGVYTMEKPDPYIYTTIPGDYIISAWKTGDGAKFTVTSDKKGESSTAWTGTEYITATFPDQEWYVVPPTGDTYSGVISAFHMGGELCVYTVTGVDFEATTNSGSVTIKNSWWSQVDLTMEELFGNVDPTDATSIVFTCDNVEFKFAYNGLVVTGQDEETGEDSYWLSVESENKTLTFDPALLDYDEDNYLTSLILYTGGLEEWGDGIAEGTISWTVYTEEYSNAIKEVKLADVEVVEVARYNLAGQKIAGEQKGINIIKYSDGSSKKVLVK